MEQMKGLSSACQVEKAMKEFSIGIAPDKIEKIKIAVAGAKDKGYNIVITGMNPFVEVQDTNGRSVLSFYPCFTEQVDEIIDIANRLPQSHNQTTLCI